MKMVCYLKNLCIFAGPQGLEPQSLVLETRILPLNQEPISNVGERGVEPRNGVD